jgi:uncharacterized protein (PEP-CTERM system associated)
VSDNITVVRPALSVLKEGARANLDFNYAPEYRRYAEDTGDSEVVHFLRTTGNLEIAENHLYLDGWLRADRTNITSTGRTGIDGLTGTDDDTDYNSIGLSPYFTARLGDFSVVELRLTADKVFYSEDHVNDSKGKRGEIAFGNGSMFTNQIWEVLYQQSDVVYENLADDNDSLEDNNETKLFRAELIQKITSQWAVAFAAGYEEYNLATTEDRDDSTWSVGAIYTPNPRMRFALGVGERSFGDDYYFEFSHRTSRTIWTANYEQDFISAREELDSRPLFERQDAFGNLVRDPILETSRATSRGTYNPSLTEDFYESKRFTTEFTYQTVRNTISLRGRYLERIYDSADAGLSRDTEDLELSVLLSRRLARLVSGYFRIAGTDHEQERLVYDERSATLGINYQFGTGSTLGFSLTHLERDAEPDPERDVEQDNNSYEENHVSLNVTMAF